MSTPSGGRAAPFSICAPLLDAGDELAWHRTADDLVDELEACALGRGSTSIWHGVLPVPAGLLHVPALRGGLAGEGLAERHHEGLLVDVDGVPLGQPLEG